MNKKKIKQKTNYVIIKRLEGIHILNQLINLNKMSYYKQKTKPNVLLNGVYVDRNGNLFLDSYVCLCKHLTVKQLPNKHKSLPQSLHYSFDS